MDDDPPVLKRGLRPLGAIVATETGEEVNLRPVGRGMHGGDRRTATQGIDRVLEKGDLAVPRESADRVRKPLDVPEDRDSWGRRHRATADSAGGEALLLKATGAVHVLLVGAVPLKAGHLEDHR